MIEREVRFSVNERQIENIRMHTEPLVEVSNIVDLAFGYHGFDSLSQMGFICRVRVANGVVCLEAKKRLSETTWEEVAISHLNFAEVVNFLNIIGMRPYLVLEKNREVRRYCNLKIIIDKIEKLGDFVEIEYPDEDSKSQIFNFKKRFNIYQKEEDIYGNLIQKKINEDPKFNDSYNNYVLNFLKSNNIHK